MTTRKNYHEGRKPQGETGEDLYDFTVLYMEGSDFKREKIKGRLIRAGVPEVEISTTFPLQPKQVVYWGEKHKKDHLQFGMVKWVSKTGDTCRVGLSLL